MNIVLSHAQAAKKYLLGEPINETEGQFWRQRSDEAGRRYFALQHAIGRNTMLSEVPKMLAMAVVSNDWKGWTWAGQQESSPSLGEYITRKPPRGLGATLEMARDWLWNDPKAYGIFVQETSLKPGRPTSTENHDNVIIKSEQGNSRAYTARRLAEQRPDLYAEVIASRMTVNQAAMKAGWREQQKPFAIMRRLVLKLTDEEWNELIQIRMNGNA